MPTKKTAKPVETKTDKPADEPVDETLRKVIKHFDASWKYTSGSLHARWDRNYKLYNNVRTDRGYIGISDTFVPMTFSTVETKNSALFGSKPKWNFMPPRNKPDQKTDILNALVDSYWDKDQWSIKVINTGRSGLVRGNGIDYFAWSYDHPVMINVPLRDFFIDPNATSLENARYMGRRYLTTLDELEEFEITDTDSKTDDNGNYGSKSKYQNLDKLKKPTTDVNPKGQGSTSQETTDKEEKDMFYGSTVEGDEQVEVIEYWTDDKVISIANRSVTIEDCENYFKAKARENGDEFPCGLMPFAGFRCYVDESLFYAKGEVDFIAAQQEDLNDITNQNKDSITYTLNQMYEVNTQKTSVLPGEIENLPGAVYPVSENGAIAPIQHGTVPPDAFMERQNIKSEIRETTASNEIVKGAAQDGGKATATEINAQIAGAGQRINLMVTQIEDEYFHRMGRIIFAFIRLYVTEKMTVRVVGKDGAKFEKFDPKDYAEGDYEPRVQLSITLEGKKADRAANAEKMMAMFLNDPDINQVELKKHVLADAFDLDPDEVGTLIQKQPPVTAQPPMPPMPPMGAGAPPMGDPMAAQGGMPPMAPPPMPQEDMALMQQQGGGGGQMYTDPVSGEQIPMQALM